MNTVLIGHLPAPLGHGKWAGMRVGASGELEGQQEYLPTRTTTVNTSSNSTDETIKPTRSSSSMLEGPRFDEH
jgi:hypothetical protein